MTTFLEKLRATRAIWDEDENEHALEEMRRDEKANPSARLILNIVDEVMKAIRENFIPSSDNVDAFFPCHYVILLGPDDERLTRGERLPHIKGRVVEEVYKRLRTKRIDQRRVPEKISIEIRLDANAGVGQVHVIAQDNREKVRATPRLESQANDERRTEEDASRVTLPLYFLQISLNGTLEDEVKIETAETIIGRGRSADIKLKDIDPRIGREHCKLVFDGDLFVMAMNDNPTIVNNQILNKNDRLQVSEKDIVRIYGYELKLQIPKSR